MTYSFNQLRDTTKRKGTITPARWAVMRQMREDGKSISEIANFMRCDGSTVRYAFRRMGIQYESSQPPTSEQIEQMRTIRQTGASYAAIARVIGFSPPTIRKYAK